MLRDDAAAATPAPRASPGAYVSRWTMPVLRVGMGVFLLAWGVDKLVALEGSQRIFSGMYRLPADATLVHLAGVAEIVIALLLMLGLMRKPVAWAILGLNVVSTIASWRQILDPWGKLGLGPGGTHLFLASIVIMAVSVALVLEAHVPARATRR